MVEPAADLAIALAIVSSFRANPCNHQAVILGEIGLTGEVRSISMPDKRLAEAEKLGFQQVILPKHNVIKNSKIKQNGVSDIWQALDVIFQ